MDRVRLWQHNIGLTLLLGETRSHKRNCLLLVALECSIRDEYLIGCAAVVDLAGRIVNLVVVRGIVCHYVDSLQRLQYSLLHDASLCSCRQAKQVSNSKGRVVSIWFSRTTFF